MIPDNAPQWLKDAHTENADVEIQNSNVIWKSGIWYNGDWRGGIWRGGIWYNGDWRGGIWYNGDWRGGIWYTGVWRDQTIPNRLLYMASLLGIVADNTGAMIAYKSTNSNGTGRYLKTFRQKEGEYFEEDLLPAGSGTCVKGTHVSNVTVAYNYFGPDPTAQLWKVTFKKEDLLDCDGEKCRIRGGFFEKIPWPWK